MSQPSFTLGNLSGKDVCAKVESAYSEIVHWKCKLLQVPSGAIRKRFDSDLSQLFQSYADASVLERVAITTAMILP